MKTFAFTSEKVGSIASYLGYFFLRFPGTLDPEETWNLECFDTYDHKWMRRGQIWVRKDESFFLTTPPCLMTTENVTAEVFGLQIPQSLGRISAKVRPLEFFSSGDLPFKGQIVKVRSQSYLVVHGKESPRLEALVQALIADGLEPVPPGSGVSTLVKLRGPEFVDLVSWPTPDLSSPGAPFLLERLTDGLRVARQYEKGIREDVDTECLHQYRVHVRRIRSLISLGKMWTQVPEWSRLKLLLRTLQKKTNELRDLDVLLLDFPSLKAQMPWEEGPRLTGWIDTVRRRRQEEWRRVKTWLESKEHLGLLEEIDGLLEKMQVNGESWPIRKLVVDVFQSTGRDLKRCLRRLGPAPLDTDLHGVRIRAKKLRYSLDVLGPLGSASAVKTLSAFLKETQEGLGKFQDRSILLERLKAELETFRSGGSTAEPLSFGILLGILVAEQSSRKLRAMKDSRKLGSKTFFKALDRLIEPRREETVDES